MHRTALNSKKNGRIRTTLEDVDAVVAALPEVMVRVALDIDDLTDNRQYHRQHTPPEQAERHTVRQTTEEAVA